MKRLQSCDFVLYGSDESIDGILKEEGDTILSRLEREFPIMDYGSEKFVDPPKQEPLNINLMMNEDQAKMFHEAMKAHWDSIRKK